MRQLLRGAAGARGEAAPEVALQAQADNQPHDDPLLHRARRHETLQRQEPQLGPGTMLDHAANSTLCLLLSIAYIVIWNLLSSSVTQFL